MKYHFIILTLWFLTSCQSQQTSESSKKLKDQAALIKTDVFEAGTNNYAIFRIPGLVVTSKGTLIAFCEARKTGGGDWGTIDIMMRRSVNQGETWSPMVNLTANSPEIGKNEVALDQNLGKETGQTHNNPVMIVDKDGETIHFLYCIEYARCYYSYSKDDGKSFSEPVDITGTFEAFRGEYDWKVLATGPGHGIQLGNGRLVVPVWLSTGTGGHAHRPSSVGSIYSDDQGKTWQRGEIIATDPTPLKNPSETVAVELADGRVMFNIRNENEIHRRAVAVSPDGATNWSTPEFDEALYEPICMGHILRLTSVKDGDINRIIFANPDSQGMGDNQRERRNVTVKLSYDEGTSWPISKVIDPGISGYCDLSKDQNGNIYILYERGGLGENQFRTHYLTLAKFSLDWLTDENRRNSVD